MKILLPLALVTALLLWYALHGRDWLKSKAWAQGFFAAIEPVEIWLFKKSETLLVAFTLKWLGVALTLLQQFDGVDLTPILPFMPEKWQPIATIAVNSLPLVLTAIGGIIQYLRNRTTKPVELVAVPQDNITQEVRDAISIAEYAKTAAVSVVVDTKAA